MTSELIFYIVANVIAWASLGGLLWIGKDYDDDYVEGWK